MIYWGIVICIVGCLLLIFSGHTSVQHPHVATFGASLMIVGATAAMLGGVFWAFD